MQIYIGKDKMDMAAAATQATAQIYRINLSPL